MSKNRNGALSREEKAHTPKKRADRIKLGQGTRLEIPACYKKKGFHYHWFIDRPGELEGAQAAWYEFLKDDNGNKITSPAGKGETHYAMYIDEETYKKDMFAQQAMVTAATQRNIEVKKDQGEYSPEGNANAITRDII